MTQQVFTPAEVRHLNEYQDAGFVHPFTCGSGDRCDGDGEGRLVATVRGWICPYCDYTQDWAHAGMKDGSWVAEQRELIGRLQAAVRSIGQACP